MQQRMNQQTQQQKQQQEVDAYIRKVMGALENDPDSLSSIEKQFGTKYATVIQRVRQVEADLTQTREQVRQGEARVRSLELQHQAESGRATGFLETLVSLKFESAPEVQTPPPPAPPGEGVTKGGNGLPEPELRAAVPPAAQA